MRQPPAKAFGMGGEGGVHDRLALLLNSPSLAVVDAGGREQVQPGVVVVLVIPVKERTRPGAGILDSCRSGQDSQDDT